MHSGIALTRPVATSPRQILRHLSADFDYAPARCRASCLGSGSRRFAYDNSPGPALVWRRRICRPQAAGECEERLSDSERRSISPVTSGRVR